MNRLSLAKRTTILRMLVEGSSLRSISRVTETAINTVTKLLVDAGEVCVFRSILNTCRSRSLEPLGSPASRGGFDGNETTPEERSHEFTTGVRSKPIRFAC